jgi:hypothetical protein
MHHCFMIKIMFLANRKHILIIKWPTEIGRYWRCN